MLKLGRLVATPGVLETISESCIFAALARHIQGDWGEVCETDRQLNDYALIHGERIHSAYRDAKGTKFWIITEWDRSVTTVLLPEEY